MTDTTGIQYTVPMSHPGKKQSSWRQWPLLTALLGFGLSLSQAGTAKETEVFHFGFMGKPTDSAYAGLKLGLDEANLQGNFLGQHYVLGQYPHPVQAEFSFRPGKVSAIFVAAPQATLLSISELAPGIPVFNLQAPEDTLRRTCHPNILHILPSHRMLADAVSQWQQKQPDSTAVAQAWHPDFRKYAAVQLNIRFEKAMGIKMDDSSWAGWAAMRMSADMIARHSQSIASPADLLRLLQTELRFDGQKGAPMSFRPTGQLRQPLLLVEHGKLIGEAPVRGVATELDSLGIKDCAAR